MIVDSSAIVAMLFKEPGFERIRDRLLNSPTPVRMAGVNFLETAIVIDRKQDPVPSETLDETMEEFSIEIVPFTAEHAHIARQAYRDFGKGSGHPARLNFGDTIAYALARSAGEPLLFVGDDFPHTDIATA